MQLPDYDLTTPEQQQMASILGRIATGPELSKDISQKEARDATKNILEGKIDAVRSIMFFIALRMKRETMEENLGILDGIRAVSNIQTVDVDELVDLADPYNGYNRSLPAAPFVPALLAACGVNAVSHGLVTCSPKFGVTHKQILSAAGINTDLTPEQAAKKIKTTGWSYIDQSQFCQPLYDLVDFRTLAIKRLPLTTVEVAIGPIRGKKTHLVTGYVHKPYPPVYGALAKHSGFDSAILIRGVEGAVIPSLRQVAKIFNYQQHTNDELEFDYHPKDIGIKQEVRAVPLNKKWQIPMDNALVAKAAADVGMAALSGEKGVSYDALLYCAAIILTQIGQFPTIQSAADFVKSILNSGLALDFFQK